MKTHRSLCGLLLAIFACVVFIGAPLPLAQPAFASDGSTATVSLGLSQLGLPSSVALGQFSSTREIAVPIPTGLTLSSLSGSIGTLNAAQNATVDILSGGNVVATIPVPPGAGAQSPFDVPLTGLATGTSGVNLTFSLVETDTNNSCGVADAVNLLNLTAGYSGQANAPTTVANFFPPTLSRLVLFVPTQVTSSEAQSALSLAATVAHRYRPQQFHVQVKSFDPSQGQPAVPAGDFVRGISLAPGPTAISLGSDTRLASITGSASTLTTQAAAFATAPMALAQQSKASVPTYSQPAPSVHSRKSFSQLGIGGSLNVAGSQVLDLPVDVAQLGGNAYTLTVGFHATYNAPGPNDRASLQIAVGQKQFVSQSLDNSGQVDTQFTIPHQLISRTTLITVTVDYWTNQNACVGTGEFLGFTIDPQSWVQANLVSGGNGGFANLPGAMASGFDVGFDRVAQPQLNAAVTLVAGMQQLTSVTLVPTMSTLDSMSGSSVPALVVASSASAQKYFSPPFKVDSMNMVSMTGNVPISLTTGAPIGSVQSYRDDAHGRTVVLASSSGPWSLLDPLLSTLGPASTEWNSLTGDVLATSTAGAVVNLSVVTGGTASLELPPIGPASALWKLVGALLLILVLIGIAALFPLRVRARRTAKAASLRDEDATPSP